MRAWSALSDLNLVSAAGATARCWRQPTPAFFLSALGVLLHRYTGQEDLAVGMPVMGRPARRFEESVGCFANMIVLRTSVTGAMSAGDLVADVQARMIEGLDHADVPFAAVARSLGRTPLDGPLYQVSFAYQNFFGARSLGGVAEPIPGLRQEGGDAIGFEIYEEADALRVVVNYDTTRFDAPRIARMVGHFLNIVDAMARSPETPVSALSMLSVDERDLILGRFATGGALADTVADVPSQISATAALRPDATALIVGTRSLSFRELLERAECLGSHLVDNGVQAGDPVAVLMERGADAVIALLGVLNVGATYVPLDAAQPDAASCIGARRCSAKAIVVDAKNADRLRRAKITGPFVLDADRQQADGAKIVGFCPPASRSRPSRLCHFHIRIDGQAEGRLRFARRVGASLSCGDRAVRAR